MPRKLRNKFIRIFIHRQPLHPEKLWEEFKDSMSPEFARYVEMPQARRKAYTRCFRKVSDLRSYLRVGDILRHPDHGIVRSRPHLIEPQAPSGAFTS